MSVYQRKVPFTPEQIEKLKANPYTVEVTPNRIVYSLEFKRYAVDQYKSNVKAKAIFTSAGYDYKLLGSQYCSNAILRFCAQANSKQGLRASGAEKRKKDIRDKDRTIKDLEKRIGLLEQELDLLKKTAILKAKYFKEE